MYLVLSYVENAFSSFHDSAPILSAALANCPPFPSVIYMLCMVVPKDISVEVDSWVEIYSYSCLYYPMNT